MIERFVRIYIVFAPAMFLMLAIRVGALLAGFAPVAPPLGGEATVDTFTVNHFLGTMFMLQGVKGFMGQGESFSLIAPAWSLNYEFMYYIVYAR